MTAAMANPPQADHAMAAFLNPPDDGFIYELVDGELVRLEMSNISSWVATQIARLIANFINGSAAGWVMTEASVVAFSGKGKPHGRRPDVAFFKRDRMPILTDKAATVAPNIAVEVISPSDNADYLHRKIGEYLKAGVELVWVVYPANRSVTVYRPDNTARILPDTASLTGEDVLPGFSTLIVDLFPPASDVRHTEVNETN
jgi:Uma2 family endonuclease